MSTAAHPSIRPGVQSLRAAKTIRQETRVLQGVEGTFDLKMETDERRFWICSAANLARAEGQAPAFFRPDHVLMEVHNPESDTWDSFVYGPDDTKELQMFDYFDLLGRRLDELLAREAPDSPIETRQEIRDLRRDFLALRRLWNQRE
jgi:hypothetical protein